MRHLVIGQRQKAPNFSAFHWSPHGCLITIGQYFVTKRVVHLPKRTETSLITESDQSRANHQLLQLCTVRTAWSDLDQAVRAVHSCKSWFNTASLSQNLHKKHTLIRTSIEHKLLNIPKCGKNIQTLKTINFPFRANGKLMVLGVPNI